MYLRWVWSGNIVIGRTYSTRQARTLLKFAQSTSNPQLAAVLVDKAIALKSRVDESRPGLSPLAPDVEPTTRRLTPDIRPET